MREFRYRITIDVAAAREGRPAIRVTDTRTDTETYHRRVGMPLECEVVQLAPEQRLRDGTLVFVGTNFPVIDRG